LTITGQNTSWGAGASVSLGAGVTVNSVTVDSATSLRARVDIASTAAAGLRSVTVTVNARPVVLVDGFTVQEVVGTPLLTSISLKTGVVGQGYTIGITGKDTHFVQGTTAVTFGAGISTGTITVQSPAALLVQINILNNAVVGLRTVKVTTATEVVSLADAFTITSVAPTISITAPLPSTLFGADKTTVTGTVSDSTSPVVISALDKNGSSVHVTATRSGNNFTAGNVPMREGNNVITATASNANGSSSSASVSVTLDTTPPIVSINSPANGALLTTSTVTVAGMVNDIVTGTVNPEQVTVTLNGQTATVSNRSFEFKGFNLTPGPNVVTAVAIDKAGNTAQAQITVKLQDAVGQQVINIISGDGQTAPILTKLEQPLTVQLVDATGNPVPSRAVTFKVEKGDGVVSSLTASGGSVTTLTDDKGRAGVDFTLGSRVGAGINQVSANSAGFIGQTFGATSTVGAPTQITGAGVMGENLEGIAGRTLGMPFIVIVTDVGGNPVKNRNVVFAVESGGGTFEGGSSTLTRVTDTDGKASAVPVLGAQEGVNNNRFSATLQGTLFPPVILTVTGRVEGAAAETKVSGVVLDNQNNPIPHALAKIVGTDLSQYSDAQGRFTLNSAPVGTIVLLVDGSTSTRPELFPFLAFQLMTVAGKDNTVGMPIYMPILDSENSQIVGGSQDVTLVMKGVPGVAFTVAANSATFRDGSHTGRLSLSQVLADKVPMAPPNGTTPKVVWTLQPAGTKFDPPIRVQLPNTEGLAPGQVVEAFQFDHDLEQWVSVGTARVSADGSVIVSDPGFGITKAGWGSVAPPPPPKRCLLSCGGGDTCSTSVLQNPPCQCVPQPTNEGGRCGDSPGVSTSCRTGGKCTAGVCVGGVRSIGNACDDGKFCTDNDKCTALSNCVGDTKPETPGPQVELKLDWIKEAWAGVKKMAQIMRIPNIPPELSISANYESKLVCCEEKRIDGLEESKFSATLKVERWDTDRLVLNFPPYSGNYEVTAFGKTIGVAYGISVRFVVSFAANVGRTKRECQDDTCWSGSVQAQPTATLSLFAAAANPISEPTCGPSHDRPCALVLIEGAATTGATVAVRIGCDQSAVNIQWDGVKITPTLQIGEGTFFEFTLSAPPIVLFDPQPIFDSTTSLQ